MLSIWEPVKKFEWWRPPWTVAQVLHPNPQNWSNRVHHRREKRELSRFRAEQRADTKVPEVELENGDKMPMTVAVMSATAPLAAVSRMVKAGHTVFLT